MQSEKVSEWDFLLAELEYTIGQLKFQLEGIEPGQRRSSFGYAPSPGDILRSMQAREIDFQGKLSARSNPQSNEWQKDSEGNAQAAFAHLRKITIERLRELPSDPSTELIEMVRQQLAEDRRHMTALAEHRHRLVTRDENQHDS